MIVGEISLVLVIVPEGPAHSIIVQAPHERPVLRRHQMNDVFSQQLPVQGVQVGGHE